MNIYEKLSAIQSELKAPKGNYNSFGKYKYRSCEDILEAVKPLLKEHNATIVISDSIIEVGGRVYVKADVNFWSTDDDAIKISNSALARESTDKKGMDDSQITGTASSYARKYALNGLLLIDDTKDADTDEHQEETNNEMTKPNKTYKQGQEYDNSNEFTSEQAVEFQKLNSRLKELGVDVNGEEYKKYVFDFTGIKDVGKMNFNKSDMESYLNLAKSVIEKKEAANG